MKRIKNCLYDKLVQAENALGSLQTAIDQANNRLKKMSEELELTSQSK